MPMNIAIIGAGLSGVTAAKTLQAELGDKARITVFEKSRGAGGRMSTRRTDDFEFDHGAQYLTAKDPVFQTAVERAIETGHVAPWHGKAKYLKNGTLEPDTGGDRFVALPRMNSWIKSMAAGLTVEMSTRVSGLSRNTDRLWTLRFEDGQQASGFTHVIAAIPAPQAQALLSLVNFGPLNLIEETRMEACFAVMAGFHKTLELPWDTLRSIDSPASWIAVNSAKPGRPKTGTTLMIHSGPDWSAANVERDKAELQDEILSEARKITGIDFGDAAYLTIHRWLYAAVSKGAGQPCLADSGLGLIACGDWCLGGRVEGAYLSGLAAAKTLMTWAA